MVAIVVLGALAWGPHLAVASLSIQRAFLGVFAPLAALTLLTTLIASTAIPTSPRTLPARASIRLFVPLMPERVDEGVRAFCPALVPAREPGLHALARRGEIGGGTPAGPLRDCLLRTVRVRLDDRPVAAGQLLLAIHPQSSARGLLAQLPVTAFAAGEHRLVVDEVQIPGSERRPRRHLIRFWR